MGPSKTLSPDLILSKEHGNALQDGETEGSMLWTAEVIPERREVSTQRLPGPRGGGGAAAEKPPPPPLN